MATKIFSATYSINRDYRHRQTVTFEVKAVKVILGNYVDIEFENKADMDRFRQLQQSFFVELVTK